jgi:fatty-acyl-CoA synthase
MSNPFSSFAKGSVSGSAQGNGAAAGNRRAPQDGLSYVRGDTATPLVYMTIPAMLEQAVKAHGPQLAVVFREQKIRWTWYDLAQKIDEFAAGLLSLGIVQGDRVGIWSPNRMEWLITQFATARIGAVLVNINPAYRLSELDYALNKVEMKALVTADAFKTSDYLGMLQTLAPELASVKRDDRLRLKLAKLPHLRMIIQMGASAVPGMLQYEEVNAAAGPAHRSRLDALSKGLGPDDAINIQFTSGTTGNPKGATLSHHNIVNNGIAVAQAMHLGPADKLCIPVPLYHCFGMVLGVLACVAGGSAMIFPGEGFDPLATLSAVAEEQCTALHGVPTMFIAQLQHPEFSKFNLSSLRTGIMAGAPCPIETMKRVVVDMHMREITIAYGMTETSPVSFQSAADDPLDKRVSTVGRILAHLEVKIVNEDGRIVKVGERGELCTRGYSVMKGYWNDLPRTQEAIREGWMHTGDLATLDSEGYCNIVGRVKDMLIRGGENVFPREVEEYLFRHPKIQDVQVFGVPDAKYGEEVACWIVLKPGQSASEDDIKNFCQGQIAHYKMPRHVRFVKDLPMTVTGKPQKFVMREAMMTELGLQAAKTA